MRPSEVYLLFRANLELMQLEQMQDVVTRNLNPDEFRDAMERATFIFRALGVTYENQYNALL